MKRRWTMPCSTKPGGQEKSSLSKETGAEQDVLNLLEANLPVDITKAQEEAVVAKMGGRMDHSVRAVII